MNRAKLIWLYHLIINRRIKDDSKKFRIALCDVRFDFICCERGISLVFKDVDIGVITAFFFAIHTITNNVTIFDRFTDVIGANR